MAIQTEIWLPAIEENLYKGIELIANVASDDGAYVNNKTVHIPNAGTAPTVSRGNSVYPVLIGERTDTTVEYTLTNFEIGPIRLGWADGLQLSYDKVRSVTNDFMGNMSEALRNYLLSQWMDTVSTANTVYTTGTGTTTNWLSGASGAVKNLLGDDVRNAARKLDGDKFPMTDRFMLLDYVMFWQLLKDINYNDARISVLAGMPYTLDNVYGFTVIQLPFVGAVNADTTGTVHVPAAADGTFSFGSASRPIGLAFNKSAVSWAKTGVEGFSQDKDPTMFGDILSASVYAGGKYRRTARGGIVQIQGKVS